MNSRNTSIIFAGILCLGVIVRTISYAGIMGDDDLSIAMKAAAILEHGPGVGQGHYGLRVGLIYPLAGLFGLFGIGEWQLAVLPLVMSCLGIWLAYAFGRRLIAPGVGLIAAAALACFPLDVYYATRYYPDLILGTSLALAFYLAWRSEDSERPWLWLVVSGLVWGWAYLIKIEAVFMGLVFLGLLLARRRSWLRLTIPILVFGAVIAGENLIYWLLQGEVLHRIGVIESVSMRASPEFGLTQLWVFPKSWFVTFYEFGLHYYLFFIGLVLVLIKWQKELLLIWIWAVVFLFWLQFGGNPFAENYHVKSHLARYCNMLNVPMAVIIGYTLWNLKTRSGSLFWVVFLVLLVLPALFFINFNTLNSERTVATKQALAHARDSNLFPLYMDRTSTGIARFLTYGSGKEDAIHSLQKHDFQEGKTEIRPLDELQGYVLLNRGFMAKAARRYYMQMVDIEAMQSRHKLIYRVDNPMNSLAYMQAQLLVFLGSQIPVDFLSDKISETGKRLLKGRDALVFQLSGEP